MLAALMVTGPTSLPTLAELVRRPPWMSDAACSGAGPSSWFPGRGRTDRAGEGHVPRLPRPGEMLAVRARPADDHGAWGGTSPGERHDARRRGLDAGTMIAELG
jgi:hypothetical protein